MALKTSVKAIARRIATAVASYAAQQGLSFEDYALVGSFDEQTERFSLTFGTDRAIDERQWYSGLLTAIRQAFPEHPQMTMHIGLVVQNVSNLDEMDAQNSLNANEIDLTDLLEGK
jgi:hypothetical protein